MYNIHIQSQMSYIEMSLCMYVYIYVCMHRAEKYNSTTDLITFLG